jgi:ATP-dependent DNA helicase RecG
MDIHQIEKIADQGESNNLEFKTSTAKLHSIFETICAFLNGSGGTVLIGVKNDGQIIGQDVTDNTRLEIANLLSKLEPPTSLDIDYVPVEKNKYVIKIYAVSNRLFIPYIFDGKPYWRVESSTKLMPQQRYHQLLLERTRKTDGWELAKAEHYTIDDLDKEKIINQLDESISRKRMDARFATDNPMDALQQIIPWMLCNR